MNSLISRATGNGDPGSENKMAMNLFLKKFINSASDSVTQAINSGLVAKGATAPSTASAAQPNASAGTSAPASATTPNTAQATAQSPEEIRKQKQAAAGAVAQQQMAANPVQAKAAPAVAQSPEQIRQQKQAAAAKAAQGQMAPVSKLPANQPAVQASNIRQQKQAAATAAIQGQEAPFSKVTPAPAVWSNKRNPNASPRSPIATQQPATQPTSANKQPPGFSAQNVMNLPGMQKTAVKKAPAKVPAMAENVKFEKLNNLFESMVQESSQQSISQYIVGFYKKFMQGKNMDQSALQASLPQVISLAKEAEASYPKMNGPLTKLAQLGWAVSNQAGETPTGETPPDEVTPGSTSKSVAAPAGSSNEIFKLLPKLSKEESQKLLRYIETGKESEAPAATSTATTKADFSKAPTGYAKTTMGAPAVKQAPAKTTNEPMSIGGQKINPSDPLYAKMQKQMAGK